MEEEAVPSAREYDLVYYFPPRELFQRRPYSFIVTSSRLLNQLRTKCPLPRTATTRKPSLVLRSLSTSAHSLLGRPNHCRCTESEEKDDYGELEEMLHLEGKL